MAKLKSGTRIYGTATIDTSVVVGSAVTLSSSGMQVAGISTLSSARVTGSVYDFNNAAGSTGQILQSVGTGVSWTTLSGGATLNNSPSGTLYPTMSSGTSGTYSTAYVSSTALTFTTSTGTLSATQFTSLSDASKKTNVQPIKNSIEIVEQLEGVRFDWKDNSAPSVGVIAQQVEKVLPEVVETNADGLKAVNYSGLIGVLIEAIKEQQKEINILKEKLNQ